MEEIPSILNPETEPLKENSDEKTQVQNYMDQELEEQEPINELDVKDQEQEEQEEEEEETECGFCLFMKGGGCKDTFIVWEKCIEEAEKMKEDIVDKCFEATSALKKCMEAHSGYYAPLLEAEKAAEDEKSNEVDSEELENKGKEESLNGSELND